MELNLNKTPIKCSAVSTMERSMPDYDYSHLIRELRSLIIAEINVNPDKFSKEDIQKAYDDDWFIARYLLRMKLDVKSSYNMLKKAMEFRNSPSISITEFPMEFYKIGAIFDYEPDRKGNIPIIETADKKADGKGICLVFDLQGAGINNVDMDLLFFVITTLVNYFPKGLSYMLVHELPWILRSCWLIARQWLSDDHKDLVKFSDSQNIYEYFIEEHLPDFMGGTCRRDYRALPENSITISQAAKRWDLNEDELYRIRKKFADFLPPDE